jgi:hypothetical protein
MYEVAEIASLTTLGSMVIFAGHSPIIANFDHLVFNLLFFHNFLSILFFESLHLGLDALQTVLVLQSQLDKRHHMDLVLSHSVEIIHLLLDLGVYYSFLLFKLIYTMR